MPLVKIAIDRNGLSFYVVNHKGGNVNNSYDVHV